MRPTRLDRAAVAVRRLVIPRPLRAATRSARGEHTRCVVRDSNPGHQLLSPPANRCPMSASRTTQRAGRGRCTATPCKWQTRAGWVCVWGGTVQGGCVCVCVGGGGEGGRAHRLVCRAGVTDEGLVAGGAALERHRVGAVVPADRRAKALSSATGAVETQGNGSVFSHGRSGDTRQRHCLTAGGPLPTRSHPSRGTRPGRS